MSNINFFTENISYRLQHKTKIRQLLKLLAEEEGKNIGEINYIFCSDDYLLNINKEYLKADYLTDVITFDYCEKNIISGDIYISIERVKENSKLYHQLFFQETLRIIIHGALHLCGYKDKKPSEEKTMRKKEDYYLKKYI